MTGRVLIVDDSLTVRMNLAEALSADGLDTALCASLAEARAALIEEQFSLIVLDVLLPDGDGVALLREIRERPDAERCAVMLLSTEAEVRDRIRGLTTGADEYIGKPYDPGHVLARARELLRRGRAAVAPARDRILIIDDSPTFRERLKQALGEAGFSVLIAATGEEGLRLAADARPAVIVVDSVLPGIDGATVIRRIRLDAALRRTPCLMLTASEDGGAEVRALDSGADAFVRKDEDSAVVLARIKAVLRSTEVPSQDHGTPSIMAPKKVLAVDDSETYLRALSANLLQEGFDIVLARSGEEALELLAVQPVDCILLDLMMPGIGGEETCRRIKAAPVLRDIPIVMLTSLDDRAAMIAGLDAGADDYIAKSTDFTVLRARVAAQIRRKQFEDDNRLYRERLSQKELEAAAARAAQQLAETRAAMAEQLELKNRELEAFSYSVSHDLRAPLRAVDGFGRVLEEDHAESLDATGRDYLRRMRSATQRMAELIDDLLQLSQIGRAEPKRETVDLSAIAHTVAAELTRAHPERAVAVEIANGVNADGDARLLRVVLENLLGNAWKYSRSESAAKIWFGVTEHENVIAYFVRDNGAGFDMAFAHKLFMPFERLHSGAEFPGTGIGLATVERIVTRHGGRIWAESAVGAGATFFWTLGKRIPNSPV
ncbi:MAG TPA: response regulator [Stellaceae bacterium]|nr:response regulator [Stellaceae bacterium]